MSVTFNTNVGDMVTHGINNYMILFVEDKHSEDAWGIFRARIHYTLLHDGQVWTFVWKDYVE